jgi:hypothetical protein
MAEESNKENVAARLFQLPGGSMAAPEPKKTKRSRSVGPGAAVELMKEDTGNRRKVCLPMFKLDCAC